MPCVHERRSRGREPPAPHRDLTWLTVPSSAPSCRRTSEGSGLHIIAIERWWLSSETKRNQRHLWRAHDWRRVGGLCLSVGIGPAFDRRGAVVDDLLLGAIALGERLFEGDLVKGGRPRV